jgi:hypothetical protein
VGEAYRSGGAGGSNRPNSLREPYAQGRGARDHRTDCRTRQRAAIEHAASERRAGAEYRAGVGQGAFGGYWRAPNSRPSPPVEWRMDAAALERKRPSFRLGSSGWQGIPTYWVWGPSGGAFDYAFADWRGPTGGWGNP